jgi:hypothetical protein
MQTFQVQDQHLKPMKWTFSQRRAIRVAHVAPKFEIHTKLLSIKAFGVIQTPLSAKVREKHKADKAHNDPGTAQDSKRHAEEQACHDNDKKSTQATEGRMLDDRELAQNVRRRPAARIRER